ncbi:hypothetical protein E2C01_066438 [Portunus trituberculatus]|uniref:Uncharacterized protein n=1 Tax=Portunus trituberculatus TaxID=210409 RepID=A0A5B7HUN8_PORTR|nr:hypothetical protein [Portunus trituberculatus]
MDATQVKALIKRILQREGGAQTPPKRHSAPCDGRQHPAADPRAGSITQWGTTDSRTRWFCHGERGTGDTHGNGLTLHPEGNLPRRTVVQPQAS